MTWHEALIRLESALRPGAEGTSDFDLNPDFRPPADLPTRPAGVLIAVDPGQGAPQLYLTKRASGLKHHPGQIAFPGGKVDPADGGDPIAAALREAQEEIGLDPGKVRVLGTLPAHQTITRFTVTPVLGVVRAPFAPVPEAGEVEEVFTVPLAHVLDARNFRTESRIWQGRRRHYYVVPYGPYYIWGATARILRQLAERAAP